MKGVENKGAYIRINLCLKAIHKRGYFVSNFIIVHFSEIE